MVADEEKDVASVNVSALLSLSSALSYTKLDEKDILAQPC